MAKESLNWMAGGQQGSRHFGAAGRCHRMRMGHTGGKQGRGQDRKDRTQHVGMRKPAMASWQARTGLAPAAARHKCGMRAQAGGAGTDGSRQVGSGHAGKQKMRGFRFPRQGGGCLGSKRLGIGFADCARILTKPGNPRLLVRWTPCLPTPPRWPAPSLDPNGGFLSVKHEDQSIRDHRSFGVRLPRHRCRQAQRPHHRRR